MKARPGLWAMVLVLLLLGGGLTIYKISLEPAGTGQEVVALVSGKQFEASVGGEVITATDAFLIGTSESIIKSQCDTKIASIVKGKSTRDVVVVTSSNAPGVVCIAKGTTQKVGSVEVTVRDADVVINDGKGHSYTHPDGSTIHFRQLGIRAVDSTFNNLTSLIAGILIALGVGLLVELLVRTGWRKKSSEAKGTTNRSSAAQ